MKTDMDFGDINEPMPLQAPCPQCVYEPEGCPDSDENNIWGWGKCSGFGHDCPCYGIRQGLFTEFACESCYVAQK